MKTAVALLLAGVAPAAAFHMALGGPARLMMLQPCSTGSMLRVRAAVTRHAGRAPLAAAKSRASSFSPPPAAGGGGRGGSGVTVWSNGGGGGGDDSEEGVDGEIAALLKQYNLKASDLPPGALALGAEKLSRFLASYSNGFNRWLINSWPAWRDKMLADPDFAYKLFIEETVGLGIAMSGTIAARGKDLLKELDYFLTDCAVGAVLNFVLIWLLAPTVAVKAAGSSALSSYVAKLPAFVLAEGSYSVGQRAMSGLYKGSLFAVCGFLGSVGGTSIAFMLLKLRQLIDPANNADKPLPDVVANSLGWASFMFVSTNPRYQLVNGMERAIYGMASPAVAQTSSLVLRTGNNLIGGSTWVLWARFIGLQKKKEDEDPKQKKKKKA